MPATWEWVGEVEEIGQQLNNFIAYNDQVQNNETSMVDLSNLPGDQSG